MVLLTQDPVEVEMMSPEVARRLGAKTLRLCGLSQQWMGESPQSVDPVLEKLWS
jgi:hypothetical protein